MIHTITSGLFNTNIYILETGSSRCLIVDPGGDPEELNSFMESRKLKLQGIALTHGHQDHTAAVDSLIKTWGTGIPVAVGERDRRFLGAASLKMNKDCYKAMGVMEIGILSPEFFLVETEAAVLLKEGDYLFDTDYTVIETPGHTQGSLCFYSEAEGILFSGDTLFFRGVGRTDLPGGSMEDLEKSIRNKLFTLPENTIVYPGHGPGTTIGSEKRENPFF